MTAVNWPSFFPPNCPPSESKEASVEVFRLVSSAPPSVSDFESWAQMHPKKWMGDCKASGLSVFTAKSDVLRMVRRVRGIVQGESAPEGLIASADLTPEAGKLMPTPRDGNSHHTWWAPAGFDHAAAFKVVT
jgi:hypothetical protein